MQMVNRMSTDGSSFYFLAARLRAPSWRRDKRSSSERGYGSKWQKARLAFLAANPLCIRCEAKGRAVPAAVVDPRIQHRGNQKLFWDRNNWEPACKRCHGGEIQREERGGIVHGIGRDGRPLDPAHP